MIGHTPMDHLITTKLVNHAGFDDAKKNFLDNDCHYKKGGECEYMNIGF